MPLLALSRTDRQHDPPMDHGRCRSAKVAPPMIERKHAHVLPTISLVWYELSKVLVTSSSFFMQIIVHMLPCTAYTPVARNHVCFGCRSPQQQHQRPDRPWTLSLTGKWHVWLLPYISHQPMGPLLHGSCVVVVSHVRSLARISPSLPAGLRAYFLHPSCVSLLCTYGT